MAPMYLAISPESPFYAPKLEWQEFPGKYQHRISNNHTPPMPRYTCARYIFPRWPLAFFESEPDHKPHSQPQALCFSSRESDDISQWSGVGIQVMQIWRPHYVVLENVASLCHANMCESWRYVLTELCRLGYDSKWCVVPCTACGVPVVRSRIFFLARPALKVDPFPPCKGLARPSKLWR